LRRIEEMDVSLNSKPKLDKKNLFKVIALLLILIISISFMVVSKEKFLAVDGFLAVVKNRIFNAGFKNVSSIQFEPGGHPVIEPFRAGLISAKSDGLKMYNIHGQEEWNEQSQFSNPIVKTDGNYMIIADGKGKSIHVYHNKKQIWTQTLQTQKGEILSASINENGYAGIIYRDSSYKSVVKVFNTKGFEILDRYYSNNYALNIKVSPDDKMVAIGEIDTSGMKTSSGIRFIPVGSKEDAGLFEADSVLLNMEFMGKKLIAVLDRKILSINRDGTNNVICEFGKDKITSVGISRDGFIVRARKVSGFLSSATKIEIINDKGEVVGSSDIKEKVANLTARGGVIALNTGNNVIFLNASGKQINQFKPKKDIKEVKLFKNGSYAAIVYIDSVEIVNIF